MKKRMMAVLLSLMILALLPVSVHADFGPSGRMVSPAVLVLVPESRMNSRFWVASGNYTWSYAPLYFKPEERVDSEACGAAPTDPETDASSEHLKLPEASVFSLEWDNGWRADSVSVSAWDSAVFEHPDRADDFLLETAELSDGRVTLEPGRVYMFRAIWEKDAPDEECGTADYYVVTEQMSEQESAAALARIEAPFSEEDLRFLTLRIGNAECVLGTTTPQDLMDLGLLCDVEDDVIVIRLENCDSGEIYVYTENMSPDEPIRSLNAFWAYDMPLSYCGFDGIIEDADTDPDNTWLPEEYRWTAEELREAEDDDDFQNCCLWGGMISWMESSFHMDESTEGIYSVVVTLSNGCELLISSHDSPVSLALRSD